MDGKSISLADYAYIFLLEKFDGKQALMAEFGYNMVDALERYVADSDCKIFLLILQGERAMYTMREPHTHTHTHTHKHTHTHQTNFVTLLGAGELAEEVRDDQLHMLVEIPNIMEDEDMALHNGKSIGLLPIPVFMRNLKKILSTKSEHSFQKVSERSERALMKTRI